MKKVKLIFISSITLFLLSACGLMVENKEISLPIPSKLEKTELVSWKKMNENSENPVEVNSEEIINSIKENSKFTRKESVNDQPTNIDEYIIINFYFKEAEAGGASRAYVYRDGNKAYVEQPYSGIWELEKDAFEKIEEMMD